MFIIDQTTITAMTKRPTPKSFDGDSIQEVDCRSIIPVVTKGTVQYCHNKQADGSSGKIYNNCLIISTCHSI